MPEAPASFWASIRASLRGHTHDYTRGSLGQAIVLLAIPMVFEMAMESVFALCDMLFIAQLDSGVREAALATIGLTESLLTIVYAIAIGLAMSVTALVARKIGEKDRDGAVLAATQGIAVSVIGGVAIGIVAASLAPELLAAMGADSHVREVGSAYATIMLGTNVVVMLLFVNNAVFRGAGDAVIAMRTLWIANGINLVLDPCLIFGLGPFPEMGVTGAAVATTIGRSVGVAYQFAALRRGTGRLALRGPSFRFDPDVTLRLLRLSVGGIGQFLIATASWIALIRIVSRFGTTAVAGYAMAVRIVMFALLPAFGLSNAAATLVGQNLGARQPDRAERSVWLTGLYNMAFLLVVTVVLVATADTIVGWIVQDDDPGVAHVATDCLRIFSYGYVSYAWGMVMVQAFNGAGRTMIPTWINLGCFWMFQIPLAWLLAVELDGGSRGAFWAVPIAETVMTLVAIAVFRRGTWKVLSPDAQGSGSRGA